MVHRQDNYTFLTTAPIPRVIGHMAVPTIISMLVTSLYNIADTFFVGQIDTQSTAAVGVVFAAMSVIHAVGFFFGHGTGNFMARQLGAKNKQAAQHMASTGMAYAVLLGIIITIFGECLLKPLAVMLGSTPTILPYAEKYMGIILLGAPVMIASLTLNNQMRFQGNALYAMVGVVSGAVINVVLDPVFIFAFGWGVAGAAVATVVSQTCGLLLLIIMNRRCDSIRLHWHHVSLRWRYVQEIVAGGTPSFVRQSVGCIATIMLNVAAGTFGDAAIAAMSIVTRITFVVFSVIIGLGQGFQPLCGFCYGAGNHERVKRAFWFTTAVGTAFLCLCTTAGWFYAHPVIAVFRDDPDVVRVGVEAFRWQLVAYPLGAITMHSNMLLQTIRKPWRANILAAARRGLFFIPLILVLPRMYGLLGVEICQPLCDVLSFLLTMPILFFTLRQLKGGKSEPIQTWQQTNDYQ